MVTLTRTVRSTDSSLSDLTLKDGTDDELNQPFSSGLITYTSNVDNNVASVSLTATASSSSSMIEVKVDGGVVTPAEDTGVYTVTLDASGRFTIVVKVTADNPTKITTYTITLDKAAS